MWAIGTASSSSLQMVRWVDHGAWIGGQAEVSAVRVV